MKYQLHITPQDNGGFAFELYEQISPDSTPVALINATEKDLAATVHPDQPFLTHAGRQKMMNASAKSSMVSLSDALMPMLIIDRDGIADPNDTRLSVLQETGVINEPGSVEVHAERYGYSHTVKGQIDIYTFDNTHIAQIKAPGQDSFGRGASGVPVFDFDPIAHNMDGETRLDNEKLREIRKTLTHQGVMRQGNTILVEADDVDQPNALMRNQLIRLLQDAKVAHTVKTLSEEAHQEAVTATRDEDGIISIHTLDLDDDNAIFDTMELTKEESIDFLRQCQNLGDPDDHHETLPSITHQQIRDAVLAANLEEYRPLLTFPDDLDSSPSPSM